MSTEKWVAGSGVGLTWTAAYSAAGWSDSLSNGSAISTDSTITNGTALDLYMDLSYTAGGTATTASPNYLAFYLYPLGQDGSTFGDGRFASATAAAPPGNYLVGSIGFVAAASTTIQGVVTGIIIPPGSFRIVLYNQSGAALSTNNVLKYRTYNYQVA